MRLTIKSITTMTLLAVLTAGGCYTKLMTPNEFVHTQRSQSKKVFADNSYSVNYNQSCLTCHSRTELNERSEELEYYGIRTVHDGILLSASLWSDGPGDQPVIVVPDPYWPNPYYPVNPWWMPPASMTTTTPSAAGDGNRPRTDGATRDSNKGKDRSVPVSTPTYTQPQSSSGSATPSPSTPPPAVRIAPSTPPAQTNENTRSREGSDKNNSSGRTRSDGTSRDDTGDRPK